MIAGPHSSRSQRARGSRAAQVHFRPGGEGEHEARLHFERAATVATGNAVAPSASGGFPRAALCARSDSPEVAAGNRVATTNELLGTGSAPIPSGDSTVVPRPFQAVPSFGEQPLVSGEPGSELDSVWYVSDESEAEAEADDRAFDPFFDAFDVSD